MNIKVAAFTVSVKSSNNRWEIPVTVAKKQKKNKKKLSFPVSQSIYYVSKGAKIRNRNNQVPHLTQDTNGKVTNSQLDFTNESQ